MRRIESAAEAARAGLSSSTLRDLYLAIRSAANTREDPTEALALAALLDGVCNRIEDVPVEAGEIAYLGRKLDRLLGRLSSDGLGASRAQLTEELQELRDLL